MEWEPLMQCAREVGEMARRFYASPLVAERKADRSYVTLADRYIEEFLKEHLHPLCPQAGFYGEETGGFRVEQEWLWVVDPIDGTTNFVQGLPLWGISIGLLHHGEPYAGLVYFPMFEEMYWGRIGEGAFGNGERLRVEFKEGFDPADLWGMGSGIWRRYRFSLPGVPRSLGCSCLHLVYTAKGIFRASIYRNCYLWDYAGGMAIALAAGCQACWGNGKPFRLAALADGQPHREPVIVGPPEILPLVCQHLHPLPLA